MNLPNLKDAKVRTKNQVNIKYGEYDIPENMENIGHGKYYYILTYGCQMNVHDSENISAIMEDMSYKKADDMENANVIIVNTCAIRENAHNKVSGMLGRIKHLKNIKKDIIVMFCGCMAQEESVVNTLKEKYKWIDIIFGTHNIHKIPEYLSNVINNL